MCLTVIFTGEHSSVLDVWSGYWFARQRCPLEIRALCSKCAALKCANRSMQFGAQLIFQYKDSTYGLYLIFFFVIPSHVANDHQYQCVLVNLYSHDSENYAVVASDIFVYIGALYL